MDVDLGLFAYRVDAPLATNPPTPLVARVSVAPAKAPSQPTPAGSRAAGGARAEILAAIQALTVRSGQPVVQLQQVVDELRRNGSGYAESTIRTMTTSHMCAQVHGPGVGAYDDLDRVGRGAYRICDGAATSDA